ncbi:conjugal transfer protein TraX [Paenibacillaceae bacterium]|nr:conjugal transfer protein TraX [Paenibacillaceae bacterium]
MQIIAMITMLIDHVGIVFFPNDATSELWRIIGRIAFPLYAYALVLGYHRTSNVRQYLLRLALLAIVSQWPFQAAFDTTGINAIGTLFVCLLALYALDFVSARPLQYSLSMAIKLAIVAVSAALLEIGDFDYGYYAVALVLIYRYTRPKVQVLLHFVLNVAVLFDKGWILQFYSLFSTVLLAFLPDFLRAADRIRPPRWVWRSFYPVHLAVLAIAAALL